MNAGDAGIDLKPEDYFSRALTALSEARVVVAVVDGAQVDDGVAFLVGYAFAAQKPVILYRTDGREKSAFIEGAAGETAHDLRDLARLLAKHL